MRSKLRGGTRDPFARLWRSFERGRGGWQVATAGFARRQVVTVHGARWTIIHTIHAIRGRADAMDLRASIAVWPATPRRRRVARPRDGALVEECRRRCAREARRHGYRGRWQESPYGLFGAFWKTLRGARAVAAEVKRLDRMRL